MTPLGLLQQSTNVEGDVFVESMALLKRATARFVFVPSSNAKYVVSGEGGSGRGAHHCLLFLFYCYGGVRRGGYGFHGGNITVESLSLYARGQNSPLQLGTSRAPQDTLHDYSFFWQWLE
jgi:hypothetical protein